MKKSTHSPHYEKVTQALVKMRTDAGMTQRDLAAKLKRERSFVWRIEAGERRLDLVEFFWVCRACNDDATRLYAKLVSEFNACE